MILAYLQQYGRATTLEIQKLLLDKISDALTQVQKRIRIKNLLHEMVKQDKTILFEGAKRKGSWVLANPSDGTKASSQK